MIDFVEIGTCDFDTLCETNISSGLVIEPIKHYLDKLPNRDNLIKLNIAISPTDTESTVDIYYIPPELIAEHDLPIWLKGCNSINKPHPQHSVYPYAIRQTVQCRPLHIVLAEHNITEINHLKIDTEGADCGILNCLAQHDIRPNIITFEANSLTPKSTVSETIQLYTRLGYYHKYDGNNVVMKRK